MRDSILVYERYLIDCINKMFSYKKIHIEMEQSELSLTGEKVRLTAEDLYILYQHLEQTLHVGNKLIGSESYWSIELLAQRLAELEVNIPSTLIEGG